MDTADSQQTAWGVRPSHDDVRAIRRFNRILQAMANAGEFMVFTLIAVVLVLALLMVFTGNFENIIFNDGTELSCIYDGKTEGIVNVR